MKPFAILRRREKEQRREAEGREKECAEAVTAVMRSYHCQLKPVLKGDERSIYADVLIEALPKPDMPSVKDVQPTTTHEHRDNIASDANIASADKAGEQAAREGAPIASSKVAEQDAPQA